MALQTGFLDGLYALPAASECRVSPTLCCKDRYCHCYARSTYRKLVPMALQPRYRKGDSIGGRYLVHQMLLGGMGEVYLCLDLEENLPYALKTFQQRYLTNWAIRQLFAHEAATWVALEKHPNIVRCFHMRTLDNQPFMILEWVVGEDGRGTDLRDWLRRGPLDLRTALDFAIDICRGLIHAQAKQPGIVHGDLKPENILVAQGRRAKITDFGLASLSQQIKLVPEFHGDSRHKNTIGAHGVVGTPSYMAPEQWRGDPMDPRTDIYAVGCILHEILTGSSPYQAATLSDFKRLHSTAPIPVINTKETQSEKLNAIVLRCLSKELDSRFASVEELLCNLIQLYLEQYNEEPRMLSIVGVFTASDYNSRALTYDALGRYKDALADYTLAIKLDPYFAPMYNNRGKTYAALNQHMDALADYTYAITLNPSLAIIYNNRGATYDELGWHTEALADYTHALSLDHSFELAYMNRGSSYAAQKRYSDALTDYTSAIKIDPTLALAYTARGITYQSLGQYDKALNDYTSTISLDPVSTVAYVRRGTIYNALGQYTEALADYTRAIALDPAFAPAYTLRGVIYGNMERYEDALADLSQAIKCGSVDTMVYTTRGNTFARLGRHVEALSDFSRAIECDPTDAKLYNYRGAT